MNKLLNFKEKFLLVFVISSMILGAFLEVVSIGVFLPFISQLLDLNYSENIGILNKFNTLISNFFNGAQEFLELTTIKVGHVTKHSRYVV